MWTETDLIEIIHEFPAVANEALHAIQQGDGKPPDLDSFNAAAAVLNTDAAELCVNLLQSTGFSDAFVQALLARGIEVDTDVPENARINLAGMADFLQRARTFRCRVEVDDTFRGTGCLVGPGLVLTAWHVVRVQGPGVEQNPEPKVTVVLADGSKHPAGVPPSYASPCGDREWINEAPHADSDVLDRHDVALLALRTPAARHLGFAHLPPVPPAVVSRSKLYLLDFPKGQDEQLGEGTTWKIRKVTARMRHDIETAEGSSGGACFNSRFELFGLHQGRQQRGPGRNGGKLDDGRLVPLSLFAADVAELIGKDIAPLELWHLDGENSQLVIGRDLFVSAVAAAGQDDSRVRGVRVKRRNVSSGDETGLGFSYRILNELLLRRGGEHLAVRIPLDEPVSDLVSDIFQRVQSAGVAMNAIPSPGGVDPGQAAAEAAARDQANRLAAAVNEAATKTGRTVWFFVDNPSVPLSEPARLHLEGFVASCLVQPRIRLVIAGLETLPLAGLEFSGPDAARADGPPADGGSGPPGLVVDYVGGFTRQDVLNCLTRAAESLAGQADQQSIEAMTQVALVGSEKFNGVYRDATLSTVVTRLQPYLQVLRESAGTTI
ncbi:trypsin-like peptidase domain-containing protein [Kribbella qitaiheensis]|uniref:Serine protease n=1 Tax=Kribbella qitaiheensis TaxID=1544730 RepID=A0A7G6WRH1_9ACTN|nr:serine protease [Kribbella qitaiheensis]QNE16586.1 trypsin-like peptidase domain-containing protein [Kribbella qitaiheensis]